MAGLHFPITADNSSFMKALHEVSAGVRDASRQIEEDGNNIDRTISRIKTGIASIGAGWGFKEVSSAVANTRGEFQQLEVAFKTMLGSEEKAATLMNQLVRTAAITPFDLQGVANGAKQLLAYGVSADEVNKRLTQLGDIASGLSIPLNDLVYLYGTTITQGKMFTQDLRQFQGRGIPIADELAKQFGVAKEKVGELVTAGKVGSKEFIAAIDAMTGPGSKFGGLMEAQSKTISGQISNIEDAFDTMLNDIGKSSEGLINTTLDVTSSLVENWQTVLAILGDITAAYGVQKAMLALDAGFTKAATNYGYDTEIEQLKALIPLKEEDKLTSIEQAVASGNLTESKAAEVKALREEANAYLETLTIKQAEAKQAEIVAQANLTTALQEKAIADDMVRSAQEKWEAAYDTADAIAEEAASIELETAKTIQSEAADAVSTAAKEAKAASSAHVAAQQATESASTQINTAQTSGNAAASGVLTIAKEKLAVAIGKVNSALKANQFAIVTGAVIALGYAVYKLVTYQTDYKKSLDRLTEAHSKSQQGIYKESVEIERMFGKLKSAKQGTQEWEAARNQIWSKYGQYLKSLGDEKTALNNVAAAYELVKKNAIEAAKARAMDSFLQSESESYANDMANNFEKAYNLISEKYGESFAAANEQTIHNIIEGTTNVNKELLEKFDKYTTYTSTTGASQTVRSNELETVLAKSANRRRDFDKLYAKTERKFGMNRPEAAAETAQEETTLQEAYDKAKTDYETAKAEVAKMEANRKAYTQSAYENAKSNLKTYKEAYEKLGGTTKEQKGMTAAQLEAKEENAAGKLADILRKQAQERLRIEQDYEYERWQSRIDLMQEGEAKVLAQQNLDFNKEKTNLQRRLADELEAELNRQMAVFDAEQTHLAAGNKKYAKKTFRDSDIDESAMKAIETRYATLQEDLTKAQQKAESDRLQSAKESMNNYLKEFGSYSQKRKAIEEEYAQKIAEAPNRGERKIAIAQQDKALADLDFEEWQENGGMALAFGDISRLSKETVGQLISDMEKYRSKIIATFDPDKIQKFEESLANLRLADIDFNLTFGGDNEILESLRERLALQQQIADAEENEAELLNQKKLLEEELNALTLQMMTPSLDTEAVGPGGEKQEPGGINQDTVNQAEKLRVKLDAVNKSLSSSTKTSKQLQSQLNALGKVKFADIQKFSKNLLKAGDNAADLASIFSDDVSDAIQEGADKIGVMFDAFTELSSNIEALAKSGTNAVKDTTDAAKGIVDGASAGMKASAATTSTSLSTMEKASAILAIIGAAIQLATMIASMVNPDKKHEENIQRLQEQIDALEKSYKELGKAADKAFSTDASKLINQQNTLLQQQKVLIKQQMAEESAKKKSDDEKIKEYQERLEEIDELLEENREKAKEAIIGEDIKSAISNFASLYAEAWDDGTDAAQKSMQAVKSIISSALTELLKKNIQPAAQRFYDTLARAMEDGILTDAELANLDTIKAQMDALAASGEEQYKKIQERYKDLDELREELTDISFDSVRDNFKSLLTDMESSTEDFADNFSEMLRNAHVEGLMDSKYDALLKEWYAAFAEAMDDQRLTDEEREKLRQQYDAIVQQGIADRNAINDIVGGGAYSQQASKGEAWGMNQETGEELNGRFTAMVELEATNNVLVADGNAIAREILIAVKSMTGMSMTTSGSDNKDTLLAIKDMIFLSTGYLEDIARYSKSLVEINTEIVNIKNYIKDL